MASHPAPPTRKRSRWKLWLLIGVAGVALVATATAWRVQVLAERGLRAMAEDIEAIITAARSEDGRRPVLVGPATPGSAWPEYRAAIAEVAANPPSDTEGFYEDLVPGGRRDAAWVKTYRTTLDRLARGVAHDDGQFPYQWDQGALMSGPDAIHARLLLRVVRSQAQILRQNGELEEAVAWLLRGCQFSRDVGHNGTLVCDAIGAMGVGECLVDLAAIVEAGELSSAAMTRLAEQLELLEAQLPTWSRGRRNEALFLGVTLHDACTSGTIDDELSRGMKLASWRYLFSSALMVAEAWSPARDMAKIVETADDRSWSETRSLLLAAVDEMRRSNNPVVGLLTLHAVETSERIRSALAMARLLRAAVVLRTTGERLDLRDPFGDRLLWSSKGTPEKIWSVGPDAVDDGGRGSFVFENTDPDLVLPIRR